MPTPIREIPEWMRNSAFNTPSWKQASLPPGPIEGLDEAQQRDAALAQASVNLINKHKSLLETFGSVVFEIRAKSKTGQEKHALLNEDQAVFLLTLSKNSEQVVQFKHRLVTAFSKLRRKQALIDENHAKVGWQQNRELGKLQRKDISDTIKTFVEYATAQGSRSANFYYTNITKLIQNALCVASREEVDEEHLHILATAEHVAQRVLLHDMAIGLPYRKVFQDIKLTMEQFGLMAYGETS